MDILSVFIKGGWLMIPIVICSIIAVGIIIDRYLFLKKNSTNKDAFLANLKSFLKRKDIEGAIAFCMTEKTPISKIMTKGLKKYKLGHQRVKEAIEQAGRQEIAEMEKGLSALATISGVAPLLGFLGTVTGMISAFMKIQDLQGSANPSDLAGGIWEALITTAFGLAVGIIAYTFYNLLVDKINKMVYDMEVVSTDIADFIELLETSRVKSSEEVKINNGDLP